MRGPDGTEYRMRKAVEEVEFVIGRGARLVCVRPAPVPRITVRPALAARPMPRSVLRWRLLPGHDEETTDVRP